MRLRCNFHNDRHENPHRLYDNFVGKAGAVTVAISDGNREVVGSNLSYTTLQSAVFRHHKTGRQMTTDLIGVATVAARGTQLGLNDTTHSDG